MPFSEDTLTRLKADAAEITGRYPQARSALPPLLYLVQAEEGYVSDEGMAFCAEVLGITQTEVLGVATFYTMYKLEPAAEYQVGVCINTTCAIMGGDQIWSELAEHLGGDAHNDGHHDIKAPDGKVAIERLECNAACDYAPVVMVNWEFFDNQTPESARELVDSLRAGEPKAPTRGAPLCGFKQTSRILAGLADERPAQGQGGPGAATLAGLQVAKEHGMQAPIPSDAPSEAAPESSDD